MKRRNFFKALVGAIGAGPAIVKAAATEEPVTAVTLSGSNITAATVGSRPMRKLLVSSYSIHPNSVMKEISEAAWSDVEHHEDKKFLAQFMVYAEERS
jgi:hypothetical protein